MTNYLTTEEVARICRTSANTVRFWAHKGTGPRSAKIGRRRIYDEADVTAWLEAAKVGEPVAS